MIPQNFQEWQYCITLQCGIELTPEFAKSRLKTYMQYSHPETKAFIALYGPNHFNNIISWFKVIADGGKVIE